MIAGKVADALKKSIGRPDPFVTYGDFARRYGFSASFPLSWANRGSLDAAAAALKNDQAICLDLPS